MENLINIGNKIKQARLKRNLTMDFVAREVGVTRTTLFAIEKGQSNYSINILLKILDYLGLSMSFDKHVKEEARNRATRLNSKLDKNINKFVIMCVEMYAKYKKASDYDTYSLLKSKKILTELTNDYEDLHGMGTLWLNNYIDSLVKVNK